MTTEELILAMERVQKVYVVSTCTGPNVSPPLNPTFYVTEAYVQAVGRDWSIVSTSWRDLTLDNARIFPTAKEAEEKCL